MSELVTTFNGEADLLEHWLPQLTEQLTDAVNARGQAFMVVSGGRTPLPLFAALRQVDLPWHQVTIMLADDRWVATDHADSNERLVREHLLQDRAKHANFIGLVGECTDIQADSDAANQRMATIPTFDVVILGMGDDGHTASLFPCAEALLQGLQTNAAVLPVTPTTAPHQRLSLSRTRLMNTRQLYVHLKGAAKAAVIERARLEATAALPISYFLTQQQVPIRVLLAQDSSS